MKQTILQMDNIDKKYQYIKKYDSNNYFYILINVKFGKYLYFG